MSRQRAAAGHRDGARNAYMNAGRSWRPPRSARAPIVTGPAGFDAWNAGCRRGRVRGGRPPASTPACEFSPPRAGPPPAFCAACSSPRRIHRRAGRSQRISAPCSPTPSTTAMRRGVLEESCDESAVPHAARPPRRERCCRRPCRRSRRPPLAVCIEELPLRELRSSRRLRPETDQRHTKTNNRAFHDCS